MRVLMWFSIGFTAACAAAAYLLDFVWLLPSAVLCFALIALFFLKHKACRIIAVVFLGAAVAFAWNWGYSQMYLRDAMELDGKKLQTEITVTDYGYKSDYGISADGKVSYKGHTYAVKLYLYEDQYLQPGDRLVGEFEFRYTSRGAEQEPTYHQGKGIFLLATVEEYEKISASSAQEVSFPVRLRHSITQLLDQVFPEDTAAFARALLLGDSSLLTYEMDTAFSVSGIRHVIAVSGLHVSILFSLIHVLCWRQRHLTAFIGIPVLILFSAVAGFTPSIVRACIMQILIMISMVLSKEYDPPTALALSVLVLLAVNPLTITSVGFQLSVACMIGIIAFSQRIYHFLSKRKWMASTEGNGLRAKMVRGVLLSISISLSVWLVTTPLCAIHFGMISLVSIATNLLTIWMISYIFYMIMAACILGAIYLPLGSAVAWVAAWPIRLVQWIAIVLSKIPFAAVYTCSDYIVIWLIGCYVLIACFALLKFRRPRLLLCCMLVSLIAAIAASSLEPTLDSFRVSILDVGQGQCIVLKHQDRYYMVDCGGDSDTEAADTAAEYLLSQGILHLDGLILTHYDRDHAGGALNLLDRVPALRIYLPDVDSDNRIRTELTDKYAQSIQWVDDTWQIPWGEITLICGQSDTSDNESGICVLFQPDKYDILITGDRSISGEQALMDKLELPELELLVAGHHGSAGATGMTLLEATRPVAVAISVGEYNSYGHPAEELLQRLALFDCRVLRTDVLGTIEFRG